MGGVGGHPISGLKAPLPRLSGVAAGGSPLLEGTAQADWRGVPESPRRSSTAAQMTTDSPPSAFPGALTEIVIQINVLALYRCPVDKRGGVRNTTISLTAAFRSRSGLLARALRAR